MQVPLLDLKLQYQPLKPQIMAELETICDSQHFILGPKVEAFESAVATYCGAPGAVGVSSGTDALLLILMTLGIGANDAVITTPYTFFATAGCIARLGATPLFVDIEPETFNISAKKIAAFLEEKCRVENGEIIVSETGKRVRAIMPVHLYGQVCEMDEIVALGEKYRLPVIEDAAQALGAEYPSRQGVKQAGAIGEFGAFSFFPSKNLGAFGDGGMALCREKAMADRMKVLRNHGMEPRYYHHLVGGNFRIDALQAAVLSIKLPHLDAWSAARRKNAAFYREAFANSDLGEITLPVEKYADCELANHHIYNQFVIRAPRRDALCEHLAKHEIGHAIYYPVPLHLQECFAALGHREGDFPESEKAAKETLALPIYPELTEEQLAYVVETIRAFYRK